MTDYRPAQTVDEAISVLRVEQPLQSGDPRYVDLSPARGRHIRHRLLRVLETQPRDDLLHAVFASHRGTGKSTELLRLSHDLQDRYYTLYFVANTELNSLQIELEDLLLALCRRVVEDMNGLGLPIPAELLDKVTEYFSEIVAKSSVGQDYLAKAEAEVGLKSPAFFLVLTGLLKSAIQHSSQYRDEIRLQLRKYPSTLLRSVNELLQHARARLQSQSPPRDLLVIVDNLDRYPPGVIDELLVQRGDAVNQLQCHLIVTPPISLVYKPSTGPLAQHFKLETMCSVRLREDKGAPYDDLKGPGREVLLEALGKRIDLDRLLPDPRARDRLLVASGGSMRLLMRVALDAALDTAEAPITLEHVEAAVIAERSRMRDLINANGWVQALAGIASTKQLTEDEACQAVLHNELAFKYNKQYWHDVHPLVAEIPEFRRALAQLERARRDDPYAPA